MADQCRVAPCLSAPCTVQKDLKISAASSNTKFMPVNSISISQPAADGTRVFFVTPVVKEKKDTEGGMVLKITVSVEDKYGLKATPVVRAFVPETPAAALFARACGRCVGGALGAGRGT